ncbi:hypothetical protein [Dyadobacter sp. 3J3]|uniref:hypothetical protein n=1 Tax=Dyadobacter sp. 3J3 TaxID=2606600 RepID=UPI0013590777|nr:hypothetical protein [Dyadobacter sp. 3J3]
MKNLSLPQTLLLILTAAACGQDKLDSQTARALIVAEYKLPKVIDHRIAMGDPTDAKRMLDLGLEKDGFVKIKTSQTLSELGTPWITFTNKGHQYFAQTPQSEKKYNLQNVKLAEMHFGEIKGISMGSEDKSATVEYTRIYKNTTPFCRLSSIDWTRPSVHKAYFIKYDTGWKLDTGNEN